MRAILYCRVSTDDQAAGENSSLDAQEHQCRAYCAGRGWDVVTFYRVD